MTTPGLLKQDPAKIMPKKWTHNVGGCNFVTYNPNEKEKPEQIITYIVYQNSS